MTEIVDLYSQFIGEQEISLLEINAEETPVKRLILWYGHFSEILSRIPANSQGYYEGVAFEYQKHSGWIDHEEWRCTDVASFLDQLRHIDPESIHVGTRPPLTEMINVAQKCMEFNHALIFKYE